MTDFEGLSKMFREQRGGTVVYNDNINPYREEISVVLPFLCPQLLKRLRRAASEFCHFITS